MHKLLAAIIKDLRILLRDKAGLVVMFAMPVLLVVVITSIQNSTFKMLNDNKIPVVICDQDMQAGSAALIKALQKIGMFDLTVTDSTVTEKQLPAFMHHKDALVAIVVPKGFSKNMSVKAKGVANKALTQLGVAVKEESIDTSKEVVKAAAIAMYYNPVLQESFRFSVKGALNSAQQFTQNREVIQAIYSALNNEAMTDSLDGQMLPNESMIIEIPIAKDGSKIIPNATQHNVPAWTIFAMFFIVVTLSTNIVKEKLSGSFIRLKTLPTNYILTLVAKQITFISVTLAQVVVIFSLGLFLFPYIDLPKLVLPANLFSLLLVSVVCGWCAVSYGVLIGVFAKTMEQAIGLGAVSVVILAAIGGIVVPSFAMPDTLKLLMKLSPLHWCMQAYYTLFLQAGHIKEVLTSLVPLLVIIFAMQLVAWVGLKKQNLI